MRKNITEKLLVTGLVTAMAATMILAGCSSKEEETTTTTTTEETTTTTIEETTTEETTTVQETETTTEVTTEAEVIDSMQGLYEKILEAGSFSSMYAYPSDDLMDYYGIDTSLATDYVFYVSDTSPCADTVALFKCKSTTDANKIGEQLDIYFTSIQDSTKDYAPDEYAKTEETGVRVYDDFVCLIISSNVSDAMTIVEDYIQ